MKQLKIAQFDKMPLYFPLYYANTSGIAEKYGITFEFISTFGDDKTYNYLLSGLADVGISDPIFTFSKNGFNLRGTIVGTLINKLPICAVSFKKDIKINNIKDLNKYKIGSYQEYSTTNTLSKYFLSSDIKELDYKEIIGKLKSGEIDIAIITKDLSTEVLENGGKILYSFEDNILQYLFTGIYITDNLDYKYNSLIKSFLILIREALSEIKKDEKNAIKIFKSEFPELKNHKKIFENISNIWNIKLDINKIALKNSSKIWRKVYPNFLKYTPKFLKETKEENILNILKSKNISRENPYKEKCILNIIKKSIINNTEISLFGFWGASNKKYIDKDDVETLEHLEKINNKVKNIFKKGLKIKFILSDKHAEINGYNKDIYLSYLKEIEKKILEKGFTFVYLSDLWDKYNISNLDVEKYLFNINDNFWLKLSNKNKLEKSSLSKLNKNSKDYILSAKKYFSMRSIEKIILEKEFGKQVFFNYSESLHKNIFPDLPLFYFRVNGYGKTKVPWF